MTTRTIGDCSCGKESGSRMSGHLSLGSNCPLWNKYIASPSRFTPTDNLLQTDKMHGSAGFSGRLGWVSQGVGSGAAPRPPSSPARASPRGCCQHSAAQSVNPNTLLPPGPLSMSARLIRPAAAQLLTTSIPAAPAPTSRLLRQASAGTCQSFDTTLRDGRKPSKNPPAARAVLLSRLITPLPICQTRPCSSEPRLSTSACHHRPVLKSSLGFLYPPIITVAFLALATWLLLNPHSPDSSLSAPVDDMSVNVEAPGHIGNLTPEQEEKLRRLWIAIAKLCAVDVAGENGTAAADNRPESPVAALEEPDPSPKRRFSLFRRKQAESPTSVAVNIDDAKDGADDDDKYGQTKQFLKTLASQTPQTIRETIWSMVKQDHPDALVLRFLRARKWDVDRALVMLVSAMNWRFSEMCVDSDIMLNGESGALHDEVNGDEDAKKMGSDFMYQCRVGKCFLHGTDKQGRPICVVRVRLHKPSGQSAESLERYTVYIIETARLALQYPVDTATIIFDMTGFSLANMDYHPVKFMIQCFEANYPECLGTILVHNAPWVFQGIWRIIRGWLDPVVAAKVHFTNYRAGLEEYIDPSHIIKELDGEEDWEFKYEEPVPGENDKMKDTQTRDRLLAARAELYGKFEQETMTWIRSPSSEEGRKARAARDSIAAQLQAGYWELDPYVRSRSLYDRTGDLMAGGGVNWYKKEEGPKANGNGVHGNGSSAPSTD
ncbi:hypothetical protein XA68_14954 [Ophiocordyceps unilateralis]|uniref:CRAL-TRIO domain-containing protein n=1 Tax=Ophiocordyceps unilateralis TaxID=268505 RepID=A0A2A9PTT1_OPHUN|nr:hypothetical protein XA68_14954 [Ophiocordyceps unilateralis]